MNAQASAQLSSTAQFSAVCGATAGAAAANAASANASSNNAGVNAQTGTNVGTITPFGTGIQLPGLPSTSTAAGGIALAGLLLCGAGAFLLVRSSRKPF
jgi:hypothetical protein